MPPNEARIIRPTILIPAILPKLNICMIIRAVGRAVRIRPIRPDADVERARVRGRIGVGLEAVEGVGTRGAAFLRVEGEGRGGGRVAGGAAGFHLFGGDAGRAADGVAGGAVDGDVGCVAAFCFGEKAGWVSGGFVGGKVDGG